MASNTYVKGANAAPTTSSSIWLTSDNGPLRVKPEIEEKIRLIEQDQSPFTTLMENVGGSMPVSQFTFDYMEEWPIQMRVTVTAAVSATATTAYLTPINILRPGNTWYYPATGEQGVIIDPSAAAVTIQRACGDCVGAAIPAGATLLIGPMIMFEGQDKPQMLMRGTTSNTLYVGHLAHSFGYSLWSELISYRGEGEVSRETRQAIAYFKKMRERSFMMGVPGVKADPVATAVNRYFPAGLLYFAGLKNRISLNNSISYEGISRAMAKISRYASDKTFFGFCSEEVLFKVNSLPQVQNTLRTPPGIKSIGFDVNEITGVGGTKLRLVRHPLMDESGLDRQIVVTSMSDVRRRTLDNQRIIKDAQGVQPFRSQVVLSVIEGLEHTNPYGAGIIYDI